MKLFLVLFVLSGTCMFGVLAAIGTTEASYQRAMEQSR
jgi:hypothetical protein